MAHESPRAHRLRRGRRSIPNQIYLITTVTHDREPFFSDLRAGRSVVRALMAAEISARSLAFVVMPDHLHWLMQLREGRDLPNVVHFVKSVSARSVNRARRGCGAVWHKGYHDHAIRREEALQECARYIINNPVRAGLVDSADRYSLWDSVWV
jgi:putative transposase